MADLLLCSPNKFEQQIGFSYQRLIFNSLRIHIRLLRVPHLNFIFDFLLLSLFVEDEIMAADPEQLKVYYENIVKHNPTHVEAVHYLAMWHFERQSFQQVQRGSVHISLSSYMCIGVFPGPLSLLPTLWGADLPEPSFL